MTQEEKAKAYDEALNIAKETYETQPMYRAWLEKMFPELRESEDEKMMKNIRLAILSVEDAFWRTHGLTAKEAISYLEKQKNAFENGRQFGIMQEQARQELGWTDEKQKEQKPIGTDFRTAVKNLMNLHKIKNEFTEEDYDFQAKELLELVEQKPAELTSLATLLSNYLKNDFEYFATKKWDEKKWNEVMNIQASELLRTAKNELEKEQTTEWSEEDESFLDSIEEAIHSYYDLNHAPQYDYWLEEKLKSLRPSWKPSEEEMDALKTVLEHEAERIGSSKELEKANAFYEQLKKLTQKG